MPRSESTVRRATLLSVVGVFLLASGILVTAVNLVLGPDPCREQTPTRDEALFEAPKTPPSGGAVSLSLGPTTSCATMRDGSNYCWGDVPASTEATAPAARRPHARQVRLSCGGTADCLRSTLMVGENGHCVRSIEGKLMCEPAGQAAPFPGCTLDAVASVAVGTRGACAVRESRLWCWGQDGAVVGARVGHQPTKIDEAPPDLAAVALGSDRVCVLTRQGDVACGASGKDERLVFRPIDVGGPAARVTAGAHHACALTRDGHVRCWGSNGNGELGDGTQEPRESVSAVVGIAQQVTDIDAAESRTCATTEAGHVYCWGEVGTCGTRCAQRSFFSVPTPSKVPIENVVEVRLGRDHACARKRDGAVECWGDNRRHQVSAFVPFDDYGYSLDRCDITQRLDLPGSDFPVAVRWP